MAANNTQYSINDFIFTGSVVPVTSISSLGTTSACVGSGASVVIHVMNLTGNNTIFTNNELFIN